MQKGKLEYKIVGVQSGKSQESAIDSIFNMPADMVVYALVSQSKILEKINNDLENMKNENILLRDNLIKTIKMSEDLNNQELTIKLVTFLKIIV